MTLEYGLNQYPYPAGTVAPDVPEYFLELAMRLALMNGAGIAYVADAAARAALVTNGDAHEGLFVYQRDTGYTYRYLSASWKIWDVPYQTFTPTLATGTLGNGTMTGGFAVSAGVCRGWAQWVLGSSSAMTTGGGAVAPPVAAASALPTYYVMGSCIFRDASASDTYGGPLVVPAAGVGQMLPLRASQAATYAAANMGALTSLGLANPFTANWATSDFITYEYEYPVA